MSYHDFELTKDGRTFYVEAEANWENEHYGADADGNRGIDRRVFEVERITITDEAGAVVNDKELERMAEDKIACDDPADRW